MSNSVKKIELGKLYSHNKTDLEPRFCEIKDNKILNNVGWEKGVLVKSNQPIMIVEEFNLTSTTTPTTSTRRMASGAAVMETATARWMADWKEAEKLWKRNKRISGYRCLTGNKIIWISIIDMKYFNNNQ